MRTFMEHCRRQKIWVEPDLSECEEFWNYSSLYDQTPHNSIYSCFRTILTRTIADRMTDYAKHPSFSDWQHFVLFTECTISDEQAVQLKEWLRSNSQPLCQVETYMQDTAVYRAKWIKDNTRDLTISQILDHFPHLTTNGMVRGNIVHVMIHCL